MVVGELALFEILGNFQAISLGTKVFDIFGCILMLRHSDLMNDLTSFGLLRLWKDRLVSKLRRFHGMQHLDVAGGTGHSSVQIELVLTDSYLHRTPTFGGDVAFDVLEAINRVEQRSLQVFPRDADEEDETRVYFCVINPSMLEAGKQRAKKRGVHIFHSF
ncbi:hypothetical protein R1sor_007919 [Riccia sorocarpa]|uniref:Uncharacterized protein n=1 Tax=Riccia sorocarpa TaxID=122646 RepID=A0ABD3HS85_9MARC